MACSRAPKRRRAALEPPGDGLGVDGEARAGAAVVRRLHEPVHGRELGGEAQLHVPAPGAEMRDGLRQRVGEVLERQRVGVARRLEGRALVCARLLARGDPALAHVGLQAREDLGQVGEEPRDGRPLERAREVAVLAVRRAPRGEVEAPVGRGRDGLGPHRRGRGHGDGQRGLGAAVGVGLVLAPEPGDPVARELHDLGAHGRGALGHAGRHRPLARGPGEEHAARPPGPLGPHLARGQVAGERVGVPPRRGRAAGGDVGAAGPGMARKRVTEAGVPPPGARDRRTHIRRSTVDRSETVTSSEPPASWCHRRSQGWP